MGFDLNALFNNAKEAASQGMNDVLKIGGNAALGYLEDQAVQVIKADQAQHTEQAQAAITDVLNRPSTPNGIGAYFSGLVQNPALKQYGPYVIVGIVAVVGLTLFLRSK